MHIDSCCIPFARENVIFFYFQQSFTDFSTISIFLFNMFYAKQLHSLPIFRMCFADLHAFVAFSFACFCLGQTFLARQHQTWGQFCLWDLSVLEVSYLTGSCRWGGPARLVRASQAGFLLLSQPRGIVHRHPATRGSVQSCHLAAYPLACLCYLTQHPAYRSAQHLSPTQLHPSVSVCN